MMNREVRLIKNKKSRILNIYVSASNQVLYDKMRDILHREGRSMSSWFWEQADKYVAKHWHGNPQTLIEFMGEVKTLPKYKTCITSNQEIFRGEFYCRRDTCWKTPSACDECRHYRVAVE